MLAALGIVNAFPSLQRRSVRAKQRNGEVMATETLESKTPQQPQQDGDCSKRQRCRAYMPAVDGQPAPGGLVCGCIYSLRVAYNT